MPIDRDAALRTAERLLRQGKLDGAIEQYVRLAEDQPRDWNTINALGDLYVRAGDMDRAVAQFVRIADFLFAEGFFPKAAALYKKALKVRPNHEHTLFRLSDIAAQQGLFADAKLYLRQLAQQRKGRGDEKGAAECIIRLGSLDDGDADAKLAAARAAQAIGDVAAAVTLLEDAASAFDKQKREAQALDARIAAAELAPDNEALRATVARALLATGQVERAQPFMDAATAGDDPDMLVAIARTELLAGGASDAHSKLMRAVALAPDRQDAVARLADELLQMGRVDDAFACVEILVDAALFEAAFDRAAATLESFLARVRSVPALLKLVDVYVDAGFDDRLTVAQGQLADAYLEGGQANEARAIAEDLLAREPDVEVHADRLRRVLAALGVENSDDVIAQFQATPIVFDETLDFDESVDHPAEPISSNVPAEPPVPVNTPEPIPVPIEEVQLPHEPDPPPVRETFEIDLSDTLGDLLSAPPVVTTSPALEPRDEQGVDAAVLFERAQEHLRRGMATEAAAALQAATRSPQWRFKAAAQLGRLSASRGDVQGALEWFEQAAAAPSNSVDETFAVLYELADVLQRVGEPARALAVFMELEADAGGAYRDVRARVEQLTPRAAGAPATPRGDRT